MGAGGIATRPLKLCIVDKGLEMYSCTWRRNMTPCLFFFFSLFAAPCTVHAWPLPSPDPSRWRPAASARSTYRLRPLRDAANEKLHNFFLHHHISCILESRSKRDDSKQGPAPTASPRPRAPLFNGGRPPPISQPGAENTNQPITAPPRIDSSQAQHVAARFILELKTKVRRTFP